MSEPKQKPGRSRQDYGTPADFIRAVKLRLKVDNFGLDLAAHAGNAKATCWLGPGSPIGLEDALDTAAVEWCDYLGSQEWAWLNPPFGRIEPWALRCRELKCWGGQVALLVPAAVGSNWFRDYVGGGALVLALNGRLTFDGQTAPFPKDCILALFSPHVKPGFEVWNWREQLRGEAAA